MEENSRVKDCEWCINNTTKLTQKTLITRAMIPSRIELATALIPFKPCVLTTVPRQKASINEFDISINT